MNKTLQSDRSNEMILTNRLRLETAMHTLHGLVEGVVADEKVNNEEVARLANWLVEHQAFSNRHPFSEVIPRIRSILADGIVDEKERVDILWLCDRFRPRSIFYDEVSSDIQRLQGFLKGLLADNRVSEDELAGLAAWVDGHEHLHGSWPYMELDDLITRVMKDGKIDEREHDALVKFFGEFSKAP